jgi:hypothetical protein
LVVLAAQIPQIGGSTIDCQITAGQRSDAVRQIMGQTRQWIVIKQQSLQNSHLEYFG